MVSVIIPTYNAYHHLQMLLDSLEKQTVEPDQIIVVDDGSDRDYAGQNKLLCQGYGCRFIYVPTVRYKCWTKCKCMNAGIEHLEDDCDYILFLDHDSVLPKDFVETCLKIVEDVPDGIVLPVKKNVTDLGNFCACYAERKSWEHLTFWQFGTPWGNDFSTLGNYQAGHLGSIHSNIFIRADRAKTVLWDEKLIGGGGGDEDFLRRCVIHGGIILYMKDMEVIHTQGPNNPIFKRKSGEVLKYQLRKESTLKEQFDRAVERGQRYLDRTTK